VSEVLGGGLVDLGGAGAHRADRIVLGADGEDGQEEQREPGANADDGQRAGALATGTGRLGDTKLLALSAHTEDQDHAGSLSV
jgi:hypothetical protein